jgi:hypothetical protein
MHTSNKMLLVVLLTSLIVASISIFAVSSFSAPQAPGSADIPVVKGGAGTCSADFVVTDPSGKGIYDAKIRILIQYRFMALHKLDLTVGTNYEGKARIEGLPEQIKKTAEFKISHGGQSKSLSFDPEDNCHPKLEVVLGEK